MTSRASRALHDEDPRRRWAHAVFTRRIPPVEVADQLLDCLTEQRTVTLL